MVSVEELMRQYPMLDRLMAETILDCEKHGTLETFADEIRAEEERPTTVENNAPEDDNTQCEGTSLSSCGSTPP